MSRARRLLVGATSSCLLFVGVLAATERGGGVFPHERHARLFPVCEGCHAGVVSGVKDSLYPAAPDCERCHDGARVEPVAWRAPERRATNLRFSHPAHREASARAGRTAHCQSCHAAADSLGSATVGAAEPARCLQCHPAESHLAGTVICSRCHLPLAEAVALPAERLPRFPRPASHGAAEFLSNHGRGAGPGEASCAVCHARESCERCHANADRLPAVTAIARDPRVAALEAGRRPSYPTPATHREQSWSVTHGVAARQEPAGCANCHTRTSCTGCHGNSEDPTSAGRAIASLPAPRPGGATGVSAIRMPKSLHPSDIATRHGSLAATGKLECAQCHSAQECSACHSGAESRGFHAANFVERHAMDVFAGGGECQSCHDTQTFCQACHARAGLSSQGRMSAAFHTGQPMWVLSHGQAARMGMESCASCHRQNDCVQCHSAAGGWGVNPHGPGYAAERLNARSAGTCRMCHLTDPTGR